MNISSEKLGFSWLQIMRVGLVQACLGAVVVITTSTLNRIMVVEYALPALLPGVLVGIHYFVQVVRPRMGFGSDMGGRRTPWILGGIAVLAVAGFLAAAATVLMGTQLWLGISLASLAFVAIGVGVSASGTSLLVLLAKEVQADRRAPAATIVWMMMIVGFIVTAGLAGHFLDPYSGERLLIVSASVSVIAMIVSVIALWKIEPVAALVIAGGTKNTSASDVKKREPFLQALRQVWQEPAARHFTIFVFVSMLAYSSQDLILEPFAGSVFALTPGQTTKLSSVQHGGVLVGMIMVALLAGPFGKRLFNAIGLPSWAVTLKSLKFWTVGGCIASALTLLGLVCAALIGADWPIRFNVWLMGVANGAFSIAAIGSMMQLAGGDEQSSNALNKSTKQSSGREGTRMGLWGASQAIAFGCGGLIGTGASDLAGYWVSRASSNAASNQASAYSIVFGFEACLFIVSALLALRIGSDTSASGSIKKMSLVSSFRKQSI